MVLFEEKPPVITYSWELVSSPFRMETLYKLFGIFLHDEFVPSSFINIFNNLLIPIWTHACFFYVLGYHPIRLCFVAPVVLVLVIGSSFSCSCDLFDLIVHPCFSLLKYFLAPFTFWHTGCYRIILCISYLGLRISHFFWEPSFLHWRMALETRIGPCVCLWLLGCLSFIFIVVFRVFHS
jgi:hypothetical protein